MNIAIDFEHVVLVQFVSTFIKILLNEERNVSFPFESARIKFMVPNSSLGLTELLVEFCLVYKLRFPKLGALI